MAFGGTCGAPKHLPPSVRPVKQRNKQQEKAWLRAPACTFYMLKKDFPFCPVFLTDIWHIASGFPIGN